MIQWASFYETETCQPFVRNCYTKFYENPTNGLVTDIRLQTDRQTDMSSHMVFPFLFYIMQNAERERFQISAPLYVALYSSQV